MTEEDMNKLMKLVDETTPGEWRVEKHPDFGFRIRSREGSLVITGPDLKCDVEFAVSAKTAVPSLIDEVLRLRGALSKVRDVIAQSSGVYGYHSNGEIAPWYELLPGGEFEYLTEDVAP